jgi:glycoside/pentoside/hexuronide:cation symporter, GPH family
MAQSTNAAPPMEDLSLAAKFSHLRSAGYGFASIGTSAFVMVPQLYLLYFMTEILAVPALAAGVVLMLPKIWEFITDPIIGAWSDRVSSRWGRRRPMMMVGAVAFFISFAALFSPPIVGNPYGQAAVMLVLYVAATTTYTFFAVPYVSMPAEIVGGSDVRSRLVAWRMAFVSVGILFSGAGAPMLLEMYGGGKDGFAAMALAIGAVSLVSMLGTVACTGGFPSGTPATEKLVWSKAVRTAWSNQPFRWLWIAYVIQLTATAVNLSMLPYLVKHVMGKDEGYVTTAFIILTIASIVALPLFTYLGKRVGKRKALLAATPLYAFGVLALQGSSPSQVGEIFFTAAFFIVGIANAGQQLLPFAMLTDAIELDRNEHGSNREGTLTGFWVAGEKLGLAVGPLIASVGLAASGYIESAETALQPAMAISTIVWLAGLIPALIFVLSMAFVQRYSLR